MNLRLEFQLTLSADYHVGSGHRFGATIDSSLLRDHDHAPLLRGSALAGLLRDGLSDLCQLPPCQGVDQGAAERLFGSPAARKRWAYSSARADDSGIKEKAGRWGAQDVMRVRVDPRTRRAAPQALFSQEEGDARLTFTFTATCSHPTAQDEDDAALLVAAARMVRHLGAARRRGRGECRITLLKADGLPGGKDWMQEKALSEFKLRWLDRAPSTTTSEELKEPEKTARNLTAASEAGKRLRFSLMARADEPVIVAKRSETANTYESLLTIPGSSVLGAMASQAARAIGLKMNKPAPPDFIALFARGSVRVTGLSVAQKDARADRLYPSIPTPRDSFICKVNPKHPMIHFASADKPPADPRCRDCSAEMIEWAKTAPLVTVRTQPQPTQPQQREEAHITLNRKTGRVLTGNLYEYVALEAGQWFTGELECANEACWLALQDLLGFAEKKTLQMRLGKAIQRGYGLMTFFLTQMDENASSSWTLRPLEKRVASATEPLTMLLLTDAIVTDVWGRYEESFTKNWIAELFWPSVTNTAGWIKLHGQYATTRGVDSFNAARHAPRWRDRGVAAGSSVGIEITLDGLAALVSDWLVAGGVSTTDVADELAALHWRIRQIESDGIGLRTHEGFGRVAFNHPVYAPGSDLAEGLAIDEWPAGFKQSTRTTPLIEEAKFRRQWDEKLTEWEQSAKDNAKEIRLRRENWEALQDAAFEPVARLLYLCRQCDANFVREKLDELKKGTTLSTYLWNKELSERGEQLKLNPQGLELIADLIKQLEGQKASSGDAVWPIGLELIAARLAELSQRAKTGKERR